MAEPIEMPFGCWLGWAKGTMCQMGSKSLHTRGQFWGQKGARSGHVWQSVYSKRLIRGSNWYGADADSGVPDGVHISSTCQIWLNRTCAAGIRPILNDFDDHFSVIVRSVVSSSAVNCLKAHIRNDQFHVMFGCWAFWWSGTCCQTVFEIWHLLMAPVVIWKRR